MSEDPADVINQALDGELQGVNVDAIVERHLDRLDRDYTQTHAAEISEDPGWVADFSEGYGQLPSDDSAEEDEEEEEEKEAADIAPEPANPRDIPLTREKIEFIKNSMQKLQLQPRAWLSVIPEDRLNGFLQAKLGALLSKD